MNASPYSYILEQACNLVGITYPPQTAEANRFRRSISLWLGHVWKMADWPELRRYEQRTYRLPYSSSTAYSAADEVWWPLTQKYYQAVKTGAAGVDPTDSDGATTVAKWAESLISLGGNNYSASTAYTAGAQVYYPTNGYYYQCHTASTGNAPTNTSYWGRLYAFDPYVAWAQTGQTEFSGVLRVTDKDPRVTTRIEEYVFIESVNGCQVAGGPAQPWLTFRINAPRLYGAVYSTSATYTGGQVYFEATSNGTTTGDFYNWVSASAGESPSSAPTEWTKVEIPALFEHYLSHKTAADWHRAEKEIELASYHERMAMEAIGKELDTLYREERQLGRSRVVTR